MSKLTVKKTGSSLATASARMSRFALKKSRSRAVVMPPEIAAYYKEIKARELTRSDVSIYPPYTDLKLPYRVICRQRYYLDGVKQRKQFIKEIRMQEALESRALGGVRLHREFCNPFIIPLCDDELVKLTWNEKRHLETILNTKY